MSRFYFDEMMPRPVAEQLLQRGNHVVMAVDVGMIAQPDAEHLKYATAHNLVMVTMDRPFAGTVMSQTGHGGLVCWTGNQRDFGGMIQNLSQFSIPSPNYGEVE